MLTDAELAGMRATSTAALPDTCAVTRPAEDGTLDPITGEWVPNPPTTVYAGACRGRPPTTTELEILFGGTQSTVQRLVVTFPHDIAPVLIDDTVKITVSSDPQLLTRAWRVVAVNTGSWHIDRRVACEVIE